MNLTPGALLGPYQVVGLIGTGGMAKVYRARDTRLSRDVAIKVVAETVADDGSSRERFEREARLAGSVSHPNVVALYDVGFQDGKPYLVTEFLRGETLQERLAGGPIPLPRALQWAAEMAEGLAAAHERGIIHRDLKVANVFITRDEHIKLLDFGIAKLADVSGEPRGLLEETHWRTQTGAVLGTPGYMSPEQMSGGDVDARTDFFSLGAVLYEMLSGRQAFSGSSALDVGYAVLHIEPQPLPDTIPPPVAQVVRRCLEKDPARRFQSARDLAFHLVALRNPTGSSASSEARSGVTSLTTRTWSLGAITLVTGLALGAGGVFLTREPPRPQPSTQRLTYQRGMVTGARFGPDGRIVYSAAWDGAPERVFVSAPGTTESQPLDLPAAGLLAMAPEELVISLRPNNTLSLAPLVGGAPRQVAEAIRSADVSRTGEFAIVHWENGKFQLEYPRGNPIFDENGTISFPRISPTGDSVAFWNMPNLSLPNELLLVDRGGQVRHLLEAQISGLAWAPSGDEIWFSSGSALWASSRTGKRRLLYQGVSPMSLQDVGPDGQVIVNIEENRGEISVVSEQDHREHVLPCFGSQVNELDAISRDGQQLLFTAYLSRPHTSWAMNYIRPTGGAAPVKLGPFRGLDLSPDGQWVAGVGLDTHQVQLVPVGVGLPRIVHAGTLNVFLGRWFHDGKRMVVEAQEENEKQWHLFVLPLDGGPPTRLSDIPVSAVLEISPDDRRVAAVTFDGVLTLFSLDGSPPVPLRDFSPFSRPAGWGPNGQLWVFGRQKSSPNDAKHLMRYDLSLGRVVEERPVAPGDLAGFAGIEEVATTPDGRYVAFQYRRKLGSLYLLDGLLRRP